MLIPQLLFCHSPSLGMNGWTPDCSTRARGTSLAGLTLLLIPWVLLLKPHRIPTLSSNKKHSLFSLVENELPDRCQTKQSSFLSWHFHRVHGFLQQWGLEEAGNHVLTGMGRKRGRRRTRGEREQSVNILTGTHKEPVLSKNLIQD